MPKDTPKDAWTGNWSPEGLSQFDPERWLVEDTDGRKRFNARAGPRHMLGTGTRACFGRSCNISFSSALSHREFGLTSVARRYQASHVGHANFPRPCGVETGVETRTGRSWAI